MTGDKNGFTLMEMLVSLALFSVVVTISTDLFFTFQRVSRKTESFEHLVSDARLIIEQIAREVREGTIHYSAYPTLPLNTPQTTLKILDSSAVPVEFAFNASCPDNSEFPCLTIARGGSPERLSGVDTRVINAQFFISPTLDPFNFSADTGNYLADSQPRVTVALSLDNGKDAGDPNYIRYDVQTTISSRVYRRYPYPPSLPRPAATLSLRERGG